jgi:hypothetical protein
MEIIVFKVKYLNLLVLTFVHSDLNILSYKSIFDVKSIGLDAWLNDLSMYNILDEKKISYEGDMIFLRWQVNFANKQVLWRNESKLYLEASKLTSKFLFQQFSSSKSKLEDFMQGYFFFFRKIVIEVLKGKLST